MPKNAALKSVSQNKMGNSETYCEVVLVLLHGMGLGIKKGDLRGDLGI